jgi:DNA-binding NtrC family response regulator
MTGGRGAAARHVLLVEDHALLRTLLTQTLTDAGYRVTALDSADEAAACFAEGVVPDVLLADIRMPGRLSGFDLACQVLRDHPRVAILLQTGFTDVDTGRFRVLRKPYDPETLLAALADVIAEGGGFDAAGPAGGDR